MNDLYGRFNPILLTDSYKIPHYELYPEPTETVHSYLESRGGVFDRTVFFGLQYYLMRYLAGSIVTSADVDEALELCNPHFGMELVNVEGWYRIIEKHDGKLPVSIHAVPEGTVSDTSTVLMTIENTDPKFAWLTNYLETLLSELWYPITVATQSFHMRNTLNKYLEATGTPADIPFKLHDFGFRGVSSLETAGIGGGAHLTTFMGTDNLAGLTFLRVFYSAPCAGLSIVASEHSNITAWGEKNEVEAFRNMLRKFPTGLIACVSDSYNIYEACETLWGTILKDEVMSRDGTLVIRPDSGHPPTVVLRCLEILGRKFGFTTNDKGFKVLDPHVRMIYGDGIDRISIVEIMDAMLDAGWSVDNIAFGSGGALLQKLDRDTNMFAIKCSETTQNGVRIPAYKNPVDAAYKRSKQGRFDGLPEVFRNGEILKTFTLDEIRARINTY